jgi:hypothetical protein
LNNLQSDENKNFRKMSMPNRSQTLTPADGLNMAKRKRWLCRAALSNETNVHFDDFKPVSCIVRYFSEET